jgi:hypothetical protein
MLKSSCLSLLILVLSDSIIAQTFQKTFGGAENDNATAMEQTADGGYILAGATLSFGPTAGTSNIYLIKTDSNGFPVWTKTYGDIMGDQGFSVHQTSDLGYIITGHGGAEISPYLNGIILVRINSSGDIVWKRTFGSSNAPGYLGNSVRETNDGGFVVTGYSDTFSTNDRLYLIKVNQAGDTVWTRIIGGTGNTVGTKVIQTPDSGYVVCGFTSAFGAGGHDFLLMKLDFDGNMIWVKAYGGPGDDYAWGLQPATDGGFVISGHTRSFGQGDYDVLLIKTDDAGNLLWSKTYGGVKRDLSFSVRETADRGFIIAGASDSFGPDSSDVYLIKTDSTGNLQWSRIYGGPGKDQGNAVCGMPGGGYFVSGWTRSFGSGGYDVYLIRTDSSGHSGCNENSPATVSAIPPTQQFSSFLPSTSGVIVVDPKVINVVGGVITAICHTGMSETSIGFNDEFIYPNPSNGIVNVKCSFPLNETPALQLFDTMGKLIYREKLNDCKTFLDLSAVSDGLYMCLLVNKHGVVLRSGKLMLIRN